MNQDLPKPTALAIDVEQWRSDVKTFVETTKQALDTIVSQLSNSCSGRNETVDSFLSDNEYIGVPEERSLVEEGSLSSEIHGDDRLAKLKSELATRIANSNQGS